MNTKKIILIVLILLIISILLYSAYINSKPIIWMYWENRPNTKRPGYIDLCIDSVKNHCSKCFNIIVCNEKTIYHYIPEVMQYSEELAKLPIPQKVDIYRYYLLEKFGGIWIDADTVCLKCLCPIHNKLEKYEYVGVGNGYSVEEHKKTRSNYNKPLNWMIMTKAHDPYITCVRDEATSRIGKESRNYHNFGKDVLWKCLDVQREKDPNWEYYHLPSVCNDYDSDANVLNMIFEPFNTEDCLEERYIFPLYHTGAPTGHKYEDWFKKMTKEELLKSDFPVSPIFRQAFATKNRH